MKEEIKKNKVEALAKKLSIAGDASRLKILCILFENKKVCVSEIAKVLGMSVAIISHHLQALSKAGLIEANREGKKVCYLLLKSRFNNDLRDFICRNK